jgi:Ca-activated chloride channel family protein
MNKRSSLILMVLMVVISAYGQNERKVIRDGVRAYDEGEYAKAEVQFRKAENINQESYEADFNTGAALYGQEKYEETVKQYESLLAQADDEKRAAQIWHNIGNSLLEAQQYEPSIEAYKNSLRKDPLDEDTRYNLAYAKQKLIEQQQQENQEKENQDERNQDKNTGQQGQNKAQEGQNKNQEQQDQDTEKDQDKDQDQDKDKDQDQQEQEQQPAPREISKEDAERMLKAIQQQEKDVKEKVDKKKAAAAKVKTEKDW